MRENGGIHAMNSWNELVKDLDYNDRLQVQGMMDRGATPAILYFWYNIMHGSYDMFPPAILEIDTGKMKEVYPEWSTDIDHWLIKRNEKTTSREGGDKTES